jgi:C1A family cysteine protease
MVTTLQKIKAEIKKQKASWTAGDTDYGKLTDEEKRGLLGLRVDEDMLRRTYVTKRPDIVKFMADSRGLRPTDIYSEKSFKILKNWFTAYENTVDWRNRNGMNYVTEIRDQHRCAACVSFATIATLESMLLIEQGITMDLSEAELFFCGGGHCKGDWFPVLPDGTGSIQYLINNGVSREDCFPYPELSNIQDLDCNTCPDRNPVFVNDYITIWDVNQRKEYIRNIGPMIGGFDVYDDWLHYTGGIYSHVWGDYIGSHAVEIVGYDDPSNSWIVKNSHGKNPNIWGDGTGFAQIKYGECRIERFPFWGIAGTYITKPIGPFFEGKRVFKWDMVQQLMNELRADE